MGTQGKFFHAKSDKKGEFIDTHSQNWPKALLRLHATPLFVFASQADACELRCLVQSNKQPPTSDRM